MDNLSLLAAIPLMLTVFTISFLTAFHHTKRGQFWRSWALGSLFLATALLFENAELFLPGVVNFIVSNVLLVIAFSIYNLSARQFNKRRISRLQIILPFGLVALILVPAFFLANTPIPYIIANVVLSVLSFSTALEYWPRRSEALSSKYGLSVCYLLMAVSFFLHSSQELEMTGLIQVHADSQLMFAVHLMIVLIFVTSSGAFSLALAFEQVVAEHKEEAHRDPLTGAFNRREFTLRFKELLSDPYHGNFAIVQFDLDHFKTVNDNYGHGAGDEALQLCSDVMQWHLREQDCLARTGGEEFAALMPDIGEPEALDIVERIRKTIADMPLHFAPDDIRLTLSAGVYLGRGHGIDYKALLKLADDGLYQSKRSGRNKVSLVTSTQNEGPAPNGPLLETGT